MIVTLLRNLRHAIRQWVAQPAFSVFATLSLAIGMAATVTLFSAVDTLLFAPVRGLGSPAQLVELGGTRASGSFDSFSVPDFNDYALRAKAFAEVFAYRHEPVNIDTSGEPQRALGVIVSGNYFNTLQVSAYRGRLLGTDDDLGGAAPAVVATYSAWRKYFNGDETFVGKPVSINGHDFTLVGVTDPDFQGTIALVTPALYVPLHQLPLLKPGSANRLDNRATSWLSLGARLAPGTRAALAANQLSTIAGQLASEYPRPDMQGSIAIEAYPLRGVPGFLRGGLIAFSTLLFALASLLLLVACVNVASMLLARGENRRHEIAIRYVLGARRARVIAQLLTESLLLSLTAEATGVALSAVCCRLLAHLDLPTPVPVSIQISIDATALWFALACAVATALAFGLLPALRVSDQTPAASESLSSARTAGRRSRLGAVLVVAQIALTMVLLVGGGLFLRALQRAAAIDPGFDTRQVLTADFNLEPSGYVESHQIRLQTGLLDRMRALPGIDRAALAALVPLDFDRMEFGDFQIGATAADKISPFTNLVSPGFFGTLGIPVQGRDFDAHDVKGAAEVCVVNQALAHRLVPDGNVLGRSFTYGGDNDVHTLTVVGITPDGKYASLNESGEPFLFMPLAQRPRAEASLLVRTSLPAETFAQQLHSELHALDASLPAGSVRPLEDVLGLSLLPQKIAGLISLALGVVGLLLAAIGLYGLIAIHVASRTREFGVRLALGASPARITRDVLGRGARLSAIGLAIGALLSLGGAMLVSGLLFGTTIGDSLAFATAAALLAGITLLASWLPARWAGRITPMEALRNE